MEITRPSKFGGAVVTLEDERVIEITHDELLEHIIESGMNGFVSYQWGYGDCTAESSYMDADDYLQDNFNEVVKDYLSNEI